ncbi:MAG: hypothetical protein MZV64_58835 [Ignavibacteriales bacterium]|nr:hypothetical protein [Ignavibacteriales bacterium]
MFNVLVDLFRSLHPDADPYKMSIAEFFALRTNTNGCRNHPVIDATGMNEVVKKEEVQPCSTDFHPFPKSLSARACGFLSWPCNVCTTAGTVNGGPTNLPTCELPPTQTNPYLSHQQLYQQSGTWPGAVVIAMIIKTAVLLSTMRDEGHFRNWQGELNIGQTMWMWCSMTGKWFVVP